MTTQSYGTIFIYLYYFIDLSQTSLHSNYTFQIDASKNITLYVKGYEGSSADNKPMKYEKQVDYDPVKFKVK